MDRMHLRTAPLFVFAVLSVAVPARADEWPVPRGDSHEAVPFRYNAAAWKNVPKPFLDDAPACTLYAGTNYQIEADGTIDTVTHEVTRFNGRKGIDKLGEYRGIVYDPAYQKLTLNEARIHKPDGRVVPIEPRHVQVRDVVTDYQVYDHDKQLVISFPSLEVGDVMEVKWTTRGKNPEHQGQFFTRYNFGDEHFPVVLDELRVRLPRAKTLKYATVGGNLDPEIKDEGDTRLYHWKAPLREQLPLDDNLPSKEELRLQVAISTFASWEEVARWKQALREDCWECTPEIHRLVAEVTKGLRSQLDKAKALTYWVRHNIRYVSVGEKHDYTPHSPAQVLGYRYGDCKDQSQLLAVMLREAGTPVELATLGTLDEGQVIESVPSPWGTHAILLVTISGKDHWVDTTANLAGWDFLPRDDRDRLCYVVDRGGVRLVKTPPLTAEDNRVEQVTHVTVGADGTSRCERTSRYTGSAAFVQRDAWSESPPGERRRQLTGELQDANSRTRLRRLTVDEEKLKDCDAPVTATMVFEIANHFAGEGTEKEGSLSDSRVWSKLLSFNLDYDRQVPADLGAPFESVHRFVLHLPPAYRLETAAADYSVQSRWGSFRLEVLADEDGRSLEFEMKTRLEKVRLEPADFDEYRKFQEEIGKHYRVWLTLRPTQKLSDAAALEARLHFVPEDTASAGVLARMYLSHGLGREAQRVLRRVLSYRPDEAGLWDLAIKAAEGPHEQEALFRQLAVRFPEEPKYAIALGATLVERGEHEKAELALLPILKNGPASAKAQAYYQLSRSFWKLGEAARALETLALAERADADVVHTAAALLLLAQAKEKVDQPREATQAYQELLKLDGESQPALAALVRLEVAGGRRAEALTYLRRYTLAVGDDPEGLADVADWHLRLGHYEEAAEMAARLQTGQVPAKVHRVRGLVALRQGNFEKASAELHSADPDEAVLEGLIRCALRTGRLDEARNNADRAAHVAAPTPDLARLCAQVTQMAVRRKAILAATKVPAGKEAAFALAADRFVCAEAAFEVGESPTAWEPLLDRAFADGAELGAAYGLRAQREVETGRLRKAAASAERSVNLSSEEWRGYYVRGRIALERGTGDGVADLTRAAELSGRKDAAVLHWLAAALAQAGRDEEAVATQREAVKLRPADTELAEQLKSLDKGARTEGPGR
jgi:tetratricopeptide (TPR) repeat protein